MVVLIPLAMLSLLFSGLCLLGLLLTDGGVIYYLKYMEEVPIVLRDQSGLNGWALDGFQSTSLWCRDIDRSESVPHNSQPLRVASAA